MATKGDLGEQSVAIKGIHHYVTIPEIKYLLDYTA